MPEKEDLCPGVGRCSLIRGLDEQTGIKARKYGIKFQYGPSPMINTTSSCTLAHCKDLNPPKSTPFPAPNLICYTYAIFSSQWHKPHP
ncbi:hypothetical protein DSO57_1035035 [Entomophthora muscae]|uniref:Uncharacterized protein n=1 Tax=Entomophthora muscae TaxID=34485 RepID=A0ACC2TLE9_9FUNG|nr:hypothetical protein DSO57_1035035 [Entomophthora muscae]